MGKRELIVHELENLPERDFEILLGFVRSLKSLHVEEETSRLAAESSLAKDWLAPEEDAAWADL